MFWRYDPSRIDCFPHNSALPIPVPVQLLLCSAPCIDLHQRLYQSPYQKLCISISVPRFLSSNPMQHHCIRSFVTSNCLRVFLYPPPLSISVCFWIPIVFSAGTFRIIIHFCWWFDFISCSLPPPVKRRGLWTG